MRKNRLRIAEAQNRKRRHRTKERSCLQEKYQIRRICLIEIRTLFSEKILWKDSPCGENQTNQTLLPVPRWKCLPPLLPSPRYAREPRATQNTLRHQERRI